MAAGVGNCDTVRHVRQRTFVPSSPATPGVQRSISSALTF